MWPEFQSAANGIKIDAAAWGAMEQRIGVNADRKKWVLGDEEEDEEEDYEVAPLLGDPAPEPVPGSRLTKRRERVEC